MNKVLSSIMVLCLLLSIALPAFSDTYVRGYHKKNGTYVAPHYRTSPNKSLQDNWSTMGNINPYTGKRGYKDPYHSNNYNTSNF